MPAFTPINGSAADGQIGMSVFQTVANLFERPLFAEKFLSHRSEIFGYGRFWCSFADETFAQVIFLRLQCDALLCRESFQFAADCGFVPFEVDGDMGNVPSLRVHDEYAFALELCNMSVSVHGLSGMFFCVVTKWYLFVSTCSLLHLDCKFKNHFHTISSILNLGIT